MPSGYFYYLNLTGDLLQKGDTLRAIDAQRMAAIASFKLGALNESEQEAVTALQWLDALEASKEVKSSRYAGLYNHLGILYRNKKHYEKALHYYSRALAHIASARDSISNLNNRGNVSMEMGDHKVAAQKFLQAIELSRRTGDTGRWARALNNLGVLYLQQNNPQGAAHIREALQLRDQINDLEGRYSGNRHLALFALGEKDTALAQNHAVTTLNLARELNSASYMLESLSLLMALKDDPLVARYKKLTDSINQAKQQEQNLYAAMRFDVEKEVLNTQRAELQLEKERNQKALILIIALLLLVLMVLVLVLILNRIRRVKQEEVFKTESRISKKVHDELANEVYHVMVKMQADNKKDEGMLDDLEHIYNKSRDISREYQVLDASVPFGETLTDLLSSYQSETIKILKRETGPIHWSRVSAVKKNAIYRVLQELMTNMKKHSRATLVAVSLSQNGRKVEILYSDNGKGTLLTKQNGLQNAENRIFTLNGTITFESQPGKGFKAKIIV